MFGESLPFLFRLAGERVEPAKQGARVAEAGMGRHVQESVGRHYPIRAGTPQPILVRVSLLLAKTHELDAAKLRN